MNRRGFLKALVISVAATGSRIGFGNQAGLGVEDALFDPYAGCNTVSFTVSGIKEGDVIHVLDDEGNVIGDFFNNSDGECTTTFVAPKNMPVTVQARNTTRYQHFSLDVPEPKGANLFIQRLEDRGYNEIQ